MMREARNVYTNKTAKAYSPDELGALAAPLKEYLGIELAYGQVLLVTTEGAREDEHKAIRVLSERQARSAWHFGEEHQAQKAPVVEEPIPNPLPYSGKEPLPPVPEEGVHYDIAPLAAKKGKKNARSAEDKIDEEKEESQS